MLLLGIIAAACANEQDDRIDVLSSQVQALNERLTRLELQAKPASSTRSKAPTYETFAVGCQAGFDFLKRQEYNQAVQAFTYILETFPHHEKAPMAGYWIGECYRLQGAGKKAQAAWKNILDRHPRSSYSDETLLSLAELTHQMGNRDQALQLLGHVRDKKQQADSLRQQWISQKG